MKRVLLALTLAFGFAASPAFAHICPVYMAQIDEALQTAELTEVDLARVLELRRIGEQLHQEGNHVDSEAVLNEARFILGLIDSLDG